MSAKKPFLECRGCKQICGFPNYLGNLGELPEKCPLDANEDKPKCRWFLVQPVDTMAECLQYDSSARP